MICNSCDLIEEVGDGSSSFEIRPLRLDEELEKFEWMKILHGVLRGSKWIMLHGLPDIALSP